MPVIYILVQAFALAKLSAFVGIGSISDALVFGGFLFVGLIFPTYFPTSVCSLADNHFAIC